MWSTRRVVLVPVLSGLLLGMLPAAALAAPKPHSPGSSTSENSSTPASIQPGARKNPQGGDVLDQLLGNPARTLRRGTPAQADLIGHYASRIPADTADGIAPGTGADGHPLYPGEVVLAARHGVIAEESAAGFNLRYADQSGTDLPRDQWIPTRVNTIYDLASLSKLFTSIAAMQQIQAGRLGLDRTVASYIPAFAANGKQGITIRQLMTHTSGLPPDPSPALWTYPTYAERVAAIYAVKPQAAPGSIYLYSDLNMLTLGKLVELVSGKTLDVAVHDGITGPLGMKDTMYNPPASLKPRIAAAEYELVPDRGLVWGQVHDENAWALNGVAGHAGVFSTAHDLAILCQMILNGGIYGTTRVLSKKSVVAMMTNYNGAFPGNDHGLGFELYQHWYMGAMATPYTVGHTGFTGPTLVIDPTTNSFVISLNNRVHPSRNWGSTNPVRRAVADDMARAVAVHPTQGSTAWYGGMVDASTATLTAPMDLKRAPAKLSFDLWYDTEPNSDFLYLEVSGDGGTTWYLAPFTVGTKKNATLTPGKVSGYDGHQWLDATADLSGWSGSVLVRWRYTTDPLYHGRGVYVDAIKVTEHGQPIFDEARAKDAAKIQPIGWVQSKN